MKGGRDISGRVVITGVINDDEFAAEGEARGNPATGEYEVSLDYKRIPRNWHPLMYTDVKVSLLFLREEGGGQNFLSLTGGQYTSAGTIDLGRGNVLRNNTQIRMVDENTLDAIYVMYGTAYTGELVGMDFFEETMLPFGPGRIAALGLARWKTAEGENLDAMFSTWYQFDQARGLKQAQVRRIEASPTCKRERFQSTYKGVVRPLPRVVEEGGPYIGHLIA